MSAGREFHVCGAATENAIFRGWCRVRVGLVECAVEFLGRIGLGLGLWLVFGCMRQLIFVSMRVMKTVYFVL